MGLLFYFSQNNFGVASKIVNRLDAEYVNVTDTNEKLSQKMCAYTTRYYLKQVGLGMDVCLALPNKEEEIFSIFAISYLNC